MRVEDHGREIEIPSAYGDLEGVGYLSGKGLGALLNMEQRATELALAEATAADPDAARAAAERVHARQLFFLFEAATLFAGASAPRRTAATSRRPRRAATDLRVGRPQGWEDRARSAAVAGEQGDRDTSCERARPPRTGGRRVRVLPPDRRPDRRRRGRRSARRRWSRSWSRTRSTPGRVQSRRARAGRHALIAVSTTARA
jgi:hypothetical protein